MEKKLNLKTIALILVIFVFPNIAFARPANPNLLPKVEPLRPPMENVAPNYQNNINALDEQVSTTEQNNSEVGIQENEKINLENQSAEKIIKNNNSSKTLKVLFFVVLILVFGAILGTFFYIYREKFKKR